MNRAKFETAVNDLTNDPIAFGERSLPCSSAAFFDADGTLFSPPTLERRLLRELHRNGLMPMRNALARMKEAVRLSPFGMEKACWENKKYLKEVPVQAAQEAIAALGKTLVFHKAAIRRVDWHAERGHAVVLVTGTLQDLAVLTATTLGGELAERGCTVKILVCATHLEESDGKWSGRVLGNVMRGKEKAVAIQKFAAEKGWRAADCWAYGDSASDRWMLDSVGHAVAVNPGLMLARLAWQRGWPILQWNDPETEGYASGSVATQAGADIKTTTVSRQ